MGRMNRSRKRTDDMNKIKKKRYEATELIRLKKTVGLIGADGNEIMEDVSEIATIRTAKEVKLDKKTKEEQEIEHELAEQRSKGKQVSVVNEKTGIVHVYNTKTLKDQFGSYPAWFKSKNTPKHKRKKDHARKKSFKQKWTTANIPL